MLSHAIPDGDIDKYNSAININLGTNFQVFIIQIMHNLGQIGNDIFLVCSCWFLLDSKKTKGEKIATLIGDAFFVSVVSLIIFWFIGYRLPIIYTIKQFIPILNGSNWFLSCYILLYAIHPFLNMVIDKLDKRKLCSLSACLFVMYCCIYFVLRNTGFYYSNIIGFITVYFITAYVKKSKIAKKMMNIKFSKKLIFVCLICQIVVNILSSYITAKTGKDLYLRWNEFNNPLFLFIAFGSIEIALNKNFSNKIINYISSLSLLVYITHTNRIMRDYVRFDIFQHILDNYSYSNLLGWCFVFFGFLLVYGFTFAIVYKGLFKKYIDKVSIEIYRKVSFWWNKVINLIVENNIDEQ